MIPGYSTVKTEKQLRYKYMPLDSRNVCNSRTDRKASLINKVMQCHNNIPEHQNNCRDMDFRSKILCFARRKHYRNKHLFMVTGVHCNDFVLAYFSSCELDQCD